MKTKAQRTVLQRWLRGSSFLWTLLPLLLLTLGQSSCPTGDGTDNDGDGFEAAPTGDDCNDNNPNVHPNAPEICNNIDDDCDGLADEEPDEDGDNWSTCDGDCNDNDPTIHPYALDGCDGIDSDCDGNIDEDANTDFDGDGFTLCANDCNDSDDTINPGASEICDNKDNDCDTLIDEDEVCGSTETPTPTPEGEANLFFSEYVEGSSYNKAVEIYNGGTEDAYLSQFIVTLASNADVFNLNGRAVTLNEGGIETLAPGNTLVLCHANSSEAILALCDLVASDETNFNGDDAVGLFYQGALIDTLGLDGFDPGAAYDVAGITEAMKDHTMIRQSWVTNGNPDWTSSAGTSLTDSEWRVLGMDDISHLGYHPHTATSAFVTFVVSVPTVTPGTVYMSGDIAELGAWMADGVPMNYEGEQIWTLDVELPIGAAFQYKYTRGTWETVEKDAGGNDIDNRTGTADMDKIISDAVVTWADNPIEPVP